MSREGGKQNGKQMLKHLLVSKKVLLVSKKVLLTSKTGMEVRA